VVLGHQTDHDVDQRHDDEEEVDYIPDALQVRVRPDEKTQRYNLDDHLHEEDQRYDIVGAGEDPALQAVGLDARPLHGQCDAVEEDHEEYSLVEQRQVRQVHAEAAGPRLLGEYVQGIGVSSFLIALVGWFVGGAVFEGVVSAVGGGDRG